MSDPASHAITVGAVTPEEARLLRTQYARVLTEAATARRDLANILGVGVAPMPVLLDTARATLTALRAEVDRLMTGSPQ